MYGPLNNELRKTLPPHVGAGHHASAKGWVESLGFKYMAAHTKEEVDTGIHELINTELERPIMLEVFTAINADINSIKEYFATLDRKTLTEKLVTKVINEVFPPVVKQGLKKLLKK